MNCCSVCCINISTIQQLAVPYSIQGVHAIAFFHCLARLVCTWLLCWTLNCDWPNLTPLLSNYSFFYKAHLLISKKSPSNVQRPSSCSSTLNEPPVVDQSRVELLRRGRRDQSSVWSQKAPLTLRQLANMTPRAGSTTCRYNVSYYTIHNM